MKIIFDSEEQKRKFVTSLCHGRLYGFDHTGCDVNCLECWSRHVEMEVKPQHEAQPIPTLNIGVPHTRPCMVGDQKATFHRLVDDTRIIYQFDSLIKFDKMMEIKRFAEKQNIIPPECSKSKEIITTCALVEFEDGTVKKVDPESVRFVNKKGE